jgi:hypothetical protein
LSCVQSGREKARRRFSQANKTFADDVGFADVGRIGRDRNEKPNEIIMAAKRPDLVRR